MKTLAVTVTNKKQEMLFTHLADELGVEITVARARFKPLSTKNAVMGIGRKFKDEELAEYTERTSRGQAKESAKVKKDLKARLTKRFASK
jgi:hypothetical protein